MFISVDLILIFRSFSSFPGFGKQRVESVTKIIIKKKKKKFRCLSTSAFVPILATMEVTNLGHCLGMGLLIDRWVWWLFRWQWWSCSGIFVGFWTKVHVMKKCFWSAGWLWLDCVNHWWWDLGLIVLVWVWLCWSGFVAIGFLIWVGLLIGFMGLICCELDVDCVWIWGRTWRIQWSWFIVNLMVLGLMISEVLNLRFFLLFSFMS